jgi:Nucleotidyltransferase domain
MSRMPSLPEALLSSLTSELATADTVALALTGSHARGDATSYSDVDILRYNQDLPEAENERYTLRYRESHLVSISTTTIAAKRAEIGQPQAAISAVPGLRQMRILYDPIGELAALQAEAEAFTWEPVRGAAEAYASETVMGYAEEAHKILSELTRRHESSLLYATLGIVLGLTRAVAVAKGVLIESENEYFERVQQVVGPDSPWTAQHRRALGLDIGPARLAPATARGIAGLHLYRETAYLLMPILKPEHRAVVNRTLEVIGTSSLAVSW